MSVSVGVRSVRCLVDDWQTIRAQVLEIKKEHAEGRKPSGRRTIIYDILTNDQIRPQDKETERLLAEALSVVAAGYSCFPMPYGISVLRLLNRTTTTAHTLSVLAFHILHNPGILNKLQHELESVMPQPDSQPRWSELEQLPYMVGYSLRFAFLPQYFIKQTHDLTPF